MRTTLSIDEDVLFAVRSLSERERKSMGRVASELMRRALKPVAAPPGHTGFPTLPVTNPEAVVTMELVNRLRDELL